MLCLLCPTGREVEADSTMLTHQPAEGEEGKAGRDRRETEDSGQRAVQPAPRAGLWLWSVYIALVRVTRSHNLFIYSVKLSILFLY